MNLSYCNILIRQHKYKDKNISVTNSILSNKDKNMDYCILYYLAIKRLLSINSDCIFTIDTVLKYIDKEYMPIGNNIRKHRIYFKDFLEEIIKLELFNTTININDLSGNDLIVLNYNKVKEKEYGFTFIAEEEIRLICNGNYKNIENIKLFNLYCDICSRIFKPNKNDYRVSAEQYKYCFPAFDNFRQDGVLFNNNTILKYLEKLVKLNLIRFDNAGDMQRGEEFLSGNFHYILVKDYPNYSEDDYEELFKRILTGYKKAKEEEGYIFNSKKFNKKKNK